MSPAPYRHPDLPQSTGPVSSSPPSGLSPLHRAIINGLQGGFPLSPRPFAEIAPTLGTNEAGLIAAIRELLGQGWLTRFGPLFNAERMGGGLVLAALAVPEERFEPVAHHVNAFPEVAHNYRRDHRLNMWFVLATESPAAIADTMGRIEAVTGLPVYAFPKEQEFYLGLWFEIGPDGVLGTRSIADGPARPPSPLDELDRRLVAATQGGLPLVPAPWTEVAEQIDCTPTEVCGRFSEMLASGIIRRIGVVPNHVRLGFRGNGMTVWDVPDERLDAVGARIGGLDFVSHCYARPRRLPSWPYNLFAMVHGRDRVAVAHKVAAMSALLGEDCRGHEVLFSSAVLKKTGLRLAV